MSSSLKARMAAFQQAASSGNNTPSPVRSTPKKKISIPRSASSYQPTTTSATTTPTRTPPKVSSSYRTTPTTPTTTSLKPTKSPTTPTKPKALFRSVSSSTPSPPKSPTRKASLMPTKTYSPSPPKSPTRKASVVGISPRHQPQATPKKFFAPTVTTSSSSPRSPKAASKNGKTTLASVAPLKTADQDQDWDFLYQLALRYDQYRSQEAEESKNPNQKPVSTAREQAPKQRHEPGNKADIKKSLEGIMGGTNFTVKGDWLTNDYFDQYLVEYPQFSTLTLDFQGQGKLFKRFDRKDDEQRMIATKFVQTLLQHPRSKEITALNMADALIPDIFLVTLAQQCMETKGLPNLQVLNLESNLLGQDGVKALAECIADPQVWRYLQFLKLDNQKLPMGTDAEQSLGEALLRNPSLVAVSLRVQSGLARQQINNSVSANIDKLRQARRQHATQTGSLKERKRNEMEQYFDNLAANSDPSLTEVNFVGNVKFLGLNPAERIKTATAFATNTTVTTLKLVKLQLDDAYAQALGEALTKNTTLSKICLDSNSFSGVGINAILKGLGQNTSVSEFEIRHQSKTMSSSDEETLPAHLADNKTIVKLGVDVRTPLIKTQLERKTSENREYQRKLRVGQRK
ncbi:hypothetical protein ACA910_019020 [Epithemia clementina (nom. ined.)]